MRRTNWKTVSTLITMFVVAGCSENVVAPAAPAAAASATAVRFAPENRPAVSLNRNASPIGSTDFTVGPNGGIFLIGTSAVVFPKGSICDPAVSSYGVGTWDDACTPLRRAIRIHAETRVSGGRTWVDFSPSLRFVPTTNASRYVWMYMYTPGAVDNSASLDQFTIFYAPTIGGSMYDESVTDASLTTYVDSYSGISLRRIKHFSGYTSMGRTCDPATSTDPNCVEDPNAGRPQ